ncbi:MAG: hypothetical protein JWP97_3053 [Labilithrix sp.]|nr:hypothetical protein [Labilithrix sp.]
MRVAAGTGNAAAQAAREVEPRRTPVTQGDIRGALARAHVKVTGRTASGATLDVLTAQASLETASGGRMYNYNFGGIKGSGPSGETAKLRTKEVLNGQEVEIRDGFRAYQSLDDGAADYVRLMKDRFPAAMAQAERGDTDAFAHALKKSGYYTANESDYAHGLRSLMGTGGASSPSHEMTGLASIPALPNFSSMLGSGASGTAGFADGPQLNRMMDAIGHAGSHHEVDDESDED